MIAPLDQVVGIVFGGVVVFAMMAFLHKRDAVDWEQLAAAYGRDWKPPRLYRRFANMILYSDGRPAKSYKGIISIGVLDDGIALRPNRVLRPFQPPVFIPYADIRGWEQGWYLDAKSAELSFLRTPHMRMIMPCDQVAWMLSLAHGAVSISKQRPPHGTRPWATYVYAWVSLGLAIGIVAFVIRNGLTNSPLPAKSQVERTLPGPNP